MFFQASVAAQAALASAKRLVPLFDRVLVQRAEAVTKTKGGIVIPEKAQGKVLTGTVVAVGPGSRNNVGSCGIECIHTRGIHTRGIHTRGIHTRGIHTPAAVLCKPLKATLCLLQLFLNSEKVKIHALYVAGRTTCPSFCEAGRPGFAPRVRWDQGGTGRGQGISFIQRIRHSCQN